MLGFKSFQSGAATLEGIEVAQMIRKSNQQGSFKPVLTLRQNPFFVLATLEVLRQADSILRHGEVTPDAGFGQYPPLAQRRVHLVKIGRAMGMTGEMLEGAEMPAQGLLLLWGRSRKVFESLAINVGLEPHPIWS